MVQAMLRDSLSQFGGRLPRPDAQIHFLAVHSRRQGSWKGGVGREDRGIRQMSSVFGHPDEQDPPCSSEMPPIQEEK